MRLLVNMSDSLVETIEKLKLELIAKDKIIDEKDSEIERLSSACANCEDLRNRWKRMHKNFQEVPGLLQGMIARTDRLFNERSTSPARRKRGLAEVLSFEESAEFSKMPKVSTDLVFD